MMTSKEKLNRLVKGEKVDDTTPFEVISPEDMIGEERDAMRKILYRLRDDGIDVFSDLSQLTEDELETFERVRKNVLERNKN